MRQHAPLLVLLAILAVAAGLVWWALDDSGGATTPGEDAAAAQDPLRGRRGRRDRAATSPDDAEEAGAAESEPPPEPAVDEPARAPEGLGVVAGNVRSDSDLAPLANAVIEVLHPTGESAGWGLTNAQGDYEVRGLPAGEILVLRVVAESHLTGLACSLVPSPARPVVRDLVLVRGPAIRVSVTDGATDGPARRVTVALFRDDKNVAHATTDDDGRAVVRAPHFGTFGVRLSGAPYAPSPREDVTLWPGQPEPRLSRRMAAGGSLAVSVASANAAVGAVTVTVTGPGYDPVEADVESDTGVALFENLPAHVTLRVVATAADGRHGATAARVGVESETAAEVELGPPSRLFGTVVDTDGRPVQEATVRIGDVLATSDADGVFDFGGIPPGDYEPLVDAPGYRPSGDAPQIRVLPAREKEITLVVAQVGDAELRGSVLDRGGRPLGGVTVRLTPAKLRSVTGDDGAYRIARLPVGRAQTITVEAPDHFLSEPGPLDSHEIQPEGPGTIEMDLVLQRYPEALAQGDSGDDGGAAGPAASEAERRERATSDAATWRGTVSGAVTGWNGGALAGVLVWVNGVAAYSGNDGRFRLVGVPFPLVGGGVEIQFAPPSAMYLPLRHFARLPERAQGGVDVEVHLRMRPVALLDVRGLEDVGGKAVPLRTFWYQSSLTDRFLGNERDAGSLTHCVTYDGTWMHLPELPGRGGLGHASVRFTRTSTRGLLTSEDAWSPVPDRLAEIRPQFPATHVALNVRAPAEYRGGRVVLQQTLPWIDSTSRIAGGDPPTFASIQVGRRVTRALDRATVTVPNLAPGTWQVELQPPRTATLPPLRKLVRAGTSTSVRFTRREREEDE